jgi:hypothetical protein
MQLLIVTEMPALGTVYMPSEPMLFVSLRNRYILKCLDGVFIDGKTTGRVNVCTRMILWM